jgi:predicted DCC family thiol-disulfide oxidoreductase YuxK
MRGDPEIATGPHRAAAGRRWLVLYDADCGLCKWLLAGLLRWDRDGLLQPVALQRPDAEDLLDDLAPDERMASWHLIAPTGARRSAGAALPEVLGLMRGGRVLAGVLARFPTATERGYEWVAAHRGQLSRWVPAGAKRRAGARVRGREPGPAAPTDENRPRARS